MLHLGEETFHELIKGMLHAKIIFILYRLPDRMPDGSSFHLHVFRENGFLKKWWQL